MNEIVTRVTNGRYEIYFRTDSEEFYKRSQEQCREMIDHKPVERFTAEQVVGKLHDIGQNSKEFANKFKVGEIMRFCPSEVERILNGEYE